MNYTEARLYLESFINYEKKTSFDYKSSLKLERVRRLFVLLGIPFRGLPVVHVAGTKGKGSVSAYCAYMFAAAGFRAGLYTSPHFFDFRERISVVRVLRGLPCEQSISRADAARIVEKIRSVLDRLDDRGREYSFFEIYTALALCYFLEQRLDFLVMETGMGGRLDATNVLTPLVSVITPVGYDHTAALGRRLCEIAREKAGVIKEGCPVITSPQRPSVMRELKRKAGQMKSPLFSQGKDFGAGRVQRKREYTCFDFRFRNTELRGLRLSMKGAHQVENACTALAALSLLVSQKRIVSLAHVRDGLARCRLAGRFETVSRRPLIVCDIAHNPVSFSALADTVKEYFPGKEIILVFGASRDKDIKNMVNRIRYTKIILTPFHSPRSLAAGEMSREIRSENAFTASSPEEAVRLGIKLAGRNSLLLVAGSVFLIADVKKFLKTRERTREG